MSTLIQPHPGQIFRSKIQQTIDDTNVVAYDMHYRFRGTDGTKGGVHLSDSDISIDAFIDTADKYGSFWLFVTYRDGTGNMFQIISDTTGEPL